MENDNLSKIRDLMLARVRGQGGTLGTLLNQLQGAPVGSDRSVMDSYRPPMPQTGYVNTEEPIGPPSVLGGLLSLDPTDYVGPNTLAKLAAGAKGLLSGAALAPIGITAWHGSPHKFDKFSLDKIGTGEGAQAYGHGLYLAESPEVAQSYAQTAWHNLASAPKAEFAGKPVEINAMGNVVGDYPKPLKSFLARVTSKGDFDTAMKEVQGALADMKKTGAFPSVQDDLAAEIEAALANKAKIKASGVSGQLYKTDIPDEAVARFLDWDKPLSQQAPEVQAAVQKLRQKNQQAAAQDEKRLSELAKKADEPYGSPNGLSDDEFKEYDRLVNRQQFRDVYGNMDSGEAFYRLLGRQGDATKSLQELGIPGIRYLDGGSRSAGQGSSNFVAFDPELIRILERNGQPTGLQPWAKGEWKPK